MEHEFSRTELIIGSEQLNKLKKSKVVVVGIGGVGSFVVEGLARAGVGHFILCDNDQICLSNLNRQIHATYTTIDKLKVDVMKERILSINKNAIVEIHPYLYNGENADKILPDTCDYVVDAIDMVTAKLDLIERSIDRGFRIISSMGTGNKLNPMMLEVTDIYKTSVCPLARVMRRELKQRKVKKLKVLYSKETPLTPLPVEESSDSTFKRRATPGSVSFVPSVGGLIIASEVVKDILKD